MGQAKARGTLEQRIAQAQLREAEMRAARERREAEAKARKAEAIAKLPPEEQKRYREREHNRHMRAANLVGLMLALSERGRNV